MYTISAAQALKFSTSSYIPVQQIRNANSFGTSLTTGMPSSTQENEKQHAVEVAAVDGALNLFKVTEKGDAQEFVSAALSDFTHTTTVIGIEDTGSSTAVDNYIGSDIYFTSGLALGLLRTISDSVGTAGAKTVTLDTALPAGKVPSEDDTFLIAPKVVITGDGQGATARAVGNDTAEITEIVVVAAGNTYSNAVVTVTQTGINSGAGPTTEGEATAMIEPRGGHGYDAVEELGGFNAMVNSRLENDEAGTFTVANDFRKIGLLSQPLKRSDSSIFTDATADQAVTLTLANFLGVAYVQDDLVTGATSGATGRVVDTTTSGGIVTLRLIDVTHGVSTVNGFDSLPGSFVSVGEALTIVGTATTADTNGVVGGDMKQFSGDILYVEHRSPVTRASDQIEDVKLIINF
jgi:hypothetical protein